MKVNEIDGKTRRNRFTRLCIGDALIQLMSETPYSKITTLDICKRAGVSRRTYYNYYITKEDIIFDYMNEIILEYKQEYKKIMGEDSLLFLNKIGPSMKGYTYDQIHYSLKFFMQYNNFIITLIRCDLEHMLYQSVNMHIKKWFEGMWNHAMYESYFIVGAFLNTYISWLKDEDKIDSSELASILYELVRRRG